MLELFLHNTFFYFYKNSHEKSKASVELGKLNTFNFNFFIVNSENNQTTNVGHCGEWERTNGTVKNCLEQSVRIELDKP